MTLISRVTNHWIAKAMLAVLLISFAGSLTACGKKSDLEKPPSKSEQTKAIKKTN